MKFKFIGTSASEGSPAPFCQCDSCERSRELGGKNLRKRSSALVNDNILIDFGPDTYAANLTGSLDLSKIKYIVFTHSHKDHFYLNELFNIFLPMSLSNSNFPITIFGNDIVISMIRLMLNELVKDTELVKERIQLNTLEVGNDFIIDNLTFHCLPARHGDFEDAFLYSISDGDSSLLYGTDSGLYLEPTMEFLKKNHHDYYIMDCTACQVSSPYEFHMGMPEIIEILKELDIYKKDDVTVYATHLAHNFGMIHHELEEVGREHDINIAYDGLELTL